jgi:hypothetical protein
MNTSILLTLKGRKGAEERSVRYTDVERVAVYDAIPEQQLRTIRSHIDKLWGSVLMDVVAEVDDGDGWQIEATLTRQCREYLKPKDP